jgi:hypothetical protein
VGNSRGELEELRLFGPVVEGDPGGSDLLVEGQVASHSLKISFSINWKQITISIQKIYYM